MALDVLLTSENFVRNATNIDQNMQSKFLLAAIRESQDMGLQSIIGTALYNRLKALVASGEIAAEDNIAYKSLLDYAQMYISYKAIANLCLISTVKLSNGGLQMTSDENISVLSVDDTWTIQKHYQDKADFYAKRLQAYIIENKKSLPEIDDNTCTKMRSNLYSAASSGLWLGGARSKKPGSPKRYL